MNHSSTNVKVIFLHHSTGETIWNGAKKSFINKIKSKFSGESAVQQWFSDYNSKNKKNYVIDDLVFPKDTPYGWNNYPFDYYNIWVKNAGNTAFKEEPTLEMLTKKYDIIVFKHCFPVSKIVEDTGEPDINSSVKSLQNYKLQYNSLKEKLLSFPDTKFIVWTGAALTEQSTTRESAVKAKLWRDWVVNEWDKKGDNIFIWDFYSLETEGGFFLKPEYAAGREDSHPNSEFSTKVFPLLCQRILNVIEDKGDLTSIEGR